MGALNTQGVGKIAIFDRYNSHSADINVFHVCVGINWRLITWLYQPDFHWSGHKDWSFILPRHTIGTSLSVSRFILCPATSLLSVLFVVWFQPFGCIWNKYVSIYLVGQCPSPPPQPMKLFYCRDSGLNQTTPVASQQPRSQSGGLHNLRDFTGASLPLIRSWL